MSRWRATNDMTFQALERVTRERDELKSLVLDMGEHIREHGFGAESDALLARLDQLGKEQT